MQPRIPRYPVIAGGVVAMTLVTLVGALAGPLWAAIFEADDRGRAAVGLAGTVIVLGGYARLLWSNLMRRITAAHRLGLALLVLLCLALPVALGPGWINALVVPAGLFAVVLPLRQAVAVTAAATVLVPVAALLMGGRGLTVVGLLAWVPVVAFSGYVQVWFCHVIQELREARAELAGTAVGAERRRFARDLHDVLGHSLQAVALRAELAERFLDEDPGRVRTELAEIQRMARDSVRDVREVVRGYRTTSLRAELDGMSAVLRAAGIRCETGPVPDGLPGHAHEPLGWVVREAVTNVLRHSSATWCRAAVLGADDRITLTIGNDGAGRRTAAPGGGLGSGLAGLAERISTAGGGFTAAATGDGVFQVTAWVPRDPMPRDPMPRRAPVTTEQVTE